MGQCAECQHFACRGDEYIENCAVCRNRSNFVRKQQPEDMNSYNINRGAGYAPNFNGNFNPNGYHANGYSSNGLSANGYSTNTRTTSQREPKESKSQKEDKDSKELSLRDKFAMVALQSPSLNLTCIDPNQIASICYNIADAMLQVRQE